MFLHAGTWLSHSTHTHAFARTRTHARMDARGQTPPHKRAQQHTTNFGCRTTHDSSSNETHAHTQTRTETHTHKCTPGTHCTALHNPFNPSQVCVMDARLRCCGSLFALRMREAQCEAHIVGWTLLVLCIGHFGSNPPVFFSSSYLSSTHPRPSPLPPMIPVAPPADSSRLPLTPRVVRFWNRFLCRSVPHHRWR